MKQIELIVFNWPTKDLYSLLLSITTTLLKLHIEGILVTICQYGEMICKTNRLPGKDTILPIVTTLTGPHG